MYLLCSFLKCDLFQNEHSLQDHIPFQANDPIIDDDSLCADFGKDETIEPPWMNSSPSSSSTAVQVLELPLRPYKEAEKRTKQNMRAKTIDIIHDCANKFVHFNPNDIPEFVDDLVNSRKWKSTFGSSESKFNSEDVFLSNLVTEYKRCKDKETNKTIQLQAAKQKQKVLIGQTLRKSRIAVSGATSEVFKSRVEAAKDLGRIRSYGDEKRRLLSIVAMDYSYSTLQKLFSCSSKTVTAARVHCILFGRGGVPSDKFKFTRQCVSPQVLEELTEFLHREDVSRPSSCRSVLVQGEETAVRYWQDTVKGLVNQYLLEFPNGVKRTYIYTHLPVNFRMNTMLAGLCNLCDDYGYSNFDELCDLITDVSSESPDLNASALIKDVRKYQRFLKTTFSKFAQKHSPCLELCMAHAFDSCSEEHSADVAEISLVYEVHNSLLQSIESLSCEDSQQSELKSRLDEKLKVNFDYLGHLLRTKHQADYYKYVQNNLKPGECVVVIDYKMKLELGKRIREIQREWYGKRGISLHGCYVVAQVRENEKSSEVLDLWSNDTKQDAFFTQSALDVCFTWLERTFPGFSVYLFSGIMCIVSYVTQSCSLN